MRSMRSVRSTVAVLAILGGACSSSGSHPAGSGGASGSGGVASSGGTTAAPSGGGGTAGQGGTTSSGGSTQVGSGGSNASGGRTGPGSSATGGRSGSGGAGVGGSATDTGGSSRTATGGSTASGGATSAGGTAGGASGGTRTSGSGGTTSPGAGGTSSSGSGGTTSPAAGGSTGASGPDGGVSQSPGCGKTRTLQNGTITIQSSRKYILKVPDGYDNTHAYRLVLAFAWSGASNSQVVSANYFTFATLDSKNTIFVAPDAANGDGNWSNSDVAFTDAILTQLEGDLCIDKSRVFATGFSMGGAMALACTRADVYRAVAFFSGADLTGSCPTTLTKPIAYYASQASEDANGMSRTSPMTGEMKQSQFAAVNGCTAEPTSTNFPSAGQPHVCTIYKGCSAGHPTEYCVFNGAHGWDPKDPGQSSSWNPPEAWKFITQF